MAVTVTHPFVSAIADGADATLVRPSNWNATHSISGTVDIVNGGTNATATPIAGAVSYGTGTAYGFTAAGTSGQVLTSSGSGTPTWATVSGSGTVTSVAATVPAFLSIAGSPITGAGTLAFTLSGAALPVLNGGTGVTTSTGTGDTVLSTSPTLVTPILGTPTSGVATNLTGTAAGLTAGNVTTNANLTGMVTSVGNAASLGSFTSAQLATALTDETGTGANVFATSPTLVTPVLGTPTSGNFSTGTFTWPTFNQNTSGTAAGLSATLAVASGGTGTTTPSIVAGTNVTVSGAWPNQTINSTGGSGGGISWQAVKTSGFTAVAGQGYLINTTSGAITATLPATPSAGDMVTFVDYAGTSVSNAITIAPNGNKIQGAVANASISTARQAVNLVYADATQGWVSYADATVVLPATYSIAYLIAGAGGGGGGNGGGGGGAGGLLTGTYAASLSTTYSFVVGSGGAGGNAGAYGTDGNNSTGFTLTAIGGGGGGYAAPTAKPGNAGGSGGGAGSGVDSGAAAAGGAGTGGQGLTGGAVDAGTSGGAGGGGAGATPANVTGATAVAGGTGVASSITGSSVTYSGGGGGGSIFGAGAAGGSGGGGAGGSAVNGAGTAGTANTGGGGGAGAGGSAPGGNGAAGGKGVVILSIATSSYTGTVTGSPTVTTSGSNTIVTFTSSGSYTA